MKYLKLYILVSFIFVIKAFDYQPKKNKKNILKRVNINRNQKLRNKNRKLFRLLKRGNKKAYEPCSLNSEC